MQDNVARFCSFQTFCHLINQSINQLVTLARPRGAFAPKKSCEKFPLKQIILNWNSLDNDLKATADITEFQSMLNRKLLSKYSYETDCSRNFLVAVTFCKL